MTEKTVTVAFAVGYFGDAFHGSQIQPDVETVEGALESALAEARVVADESRVRMASRTDAGVHARMNIGCCEIPCSVWSDMGGAGFCKLMNDRLESAVVWSAQQVADEFNPRYARRRTYRYRLSALRGCGQVDEKRLAEILANFVGEHDFSAFSRNEHDRSPIRVVERCEPWIVDDNVVGFDITAPSFIWNQVRRIAWAVQAVLGEALTEQEIAVALAGGDIETNLGIAPPNWLSLWSIEHPDFVVELPVEIAPDWFSSASSDSDDRSWKVWQSVADLEMRLLAWRTWADAYNKVLKSTEE